MLNLRTTFDPQREVMRLSTCTKLMVVAHPDDETFWGGATLARDTDWGVICLTNRDSKSRRRAFTRAVKILGAKGVILNMPDRREHPPTAEDLAWMADALRPLLETAPASVVLTHGPDGEYGHPLHQYISAEITHLIGDPDRLQYFNFSADVDLEQNAPREWALKQRAVLEYLGPESMRHPTDSLHVRLGRHEAPVSQNDYVRPTALLTQIYAGSEVNI